MREGRRAEDGASARPETASPRRRRWLVGLGIAAIVIVAGCSGGGEQASPTEDNDGSDQTGVETTSDANLGDEGDDSESPDADSGEEVEGAFVFGVEFQAGDFWAINPDTQSMAPVNTIDSETRRMWVTGNGIWLGGSSELIHVNAAGEQLGSLGLEGVYNLVADDGEVWVTGGPSTAPYFSKLDASSHSEVASIETQELMGEGGLFESLALADTTIWLSYHRSAGRATEIDRMDRNSLEVIGTTTVPIEAPSLIWDGTSLWAAGWSADSDGFGIVQIGTDGAVMSVLEITDFERSRGWDFAVTDDGVWLANLGSSELIRLDAASNSEIARIPFSGLGQMEGIHVSEDGRLWASVNQGDGSYIELTLFVIDQETNEPTAVMELPERIRATFLSDG